MYKSKLQLFAETVKGKKIIYLYRIHEDAKTDTGKAIAFTTENSKSVSKDADSTVTKDGTVRTPNEAEIEISCTSILAKGDTMISKLADAMMEDKLIEIWEANLDEPASTGNNKFKGTYYQGYLTSLEKTSSADGFVECSLSFGINGKGADGDVTVTTEQQEVAAYTFKDTVIES
ncbi:MAG: phage major tail protein, TP901-1 family [Lachnospiraceae bacterium]|nr:phage major tail protein, TP901-1 family [Lachnospiraceae bacterium]